MYKLTIETDSLEALYETVSALRDKSIVTLTSQEKPVEKKTRTRKEPSSEPKVTRIEPKPVESEPAAPGVIPYANVGKATLNYSATYGKDAALALLAGFGVKSARLLPVDKYEPYLEALEEAIRTAAKE